jgi:hypothetical protein
MQRVMGHVTINSQAGLARLLRRSARKSPNQLFPVYPVRPVGAVERSERAEHAEPTTEPTEGYCHQKGTTYAIARPVYPNAV